MPPSRDTAVKVTASRDDAASSRAKRLGRQLQAAASTSSALQVGATCEESGPLRKGILTRTPQEGDLQPVIDRGVRQSVSLAAPCAEASARQASPRTLGAPSQCRIHSGGGGSRCHRVSARCESPCRAGDGVAHRKNALNTSSAASR